jgi:cytochrome bd-type quinol oxidase subunit 1
MNGNGSEEIQKASPSERRKVVILVLIIGVLGFAATLGIEEYLEGVLELSKEEPHRAIAKLGVALKLTAGVTSLSLILLAAWIARLSLKTHKSGRFPPPGAKVIRDTKVVLGPRAHRRARVGFFLAAAAVAGAAVVPAFTWRLIDTLAK